MVRCACGKAAKVCVTMKLQGKKVKRSMCMACQQKEYWRDIERENRIMLDCVMLK